MIRVRSPVASYLRMFMKKDTALGMNRSTAQARLTRDLLWKYLCLAGSNSCHRCSKPMTRETFSIDHKVDWLQSDNPVETFFDLDNISFSHLDCNSAAGSSRVKSPCGTNAKYRNGCRCDACKAAHSISSKRYYSKERRQDRYQRTGK